MFVKGGLSVLSPSWCTKGRKKSDRQHNSEFSYSTSGFGTCKLLGSMNAATRTQLESGPRLIILFLLGISATFDTPWNNVAVASRFGIDSSHQER